MTRRRAALALATACAGCPGPNGAPSIVGGARAPEMVLALRDRGGASLAADARWLVIASWHRIARVEKASGAVTELHVEPTGGIVPTILAADADSVYFVVRGSCRDDLARAAECASVRAVDKDGGVARSLVELAPGEEAPAVLAAGTRHVHFAARNRLIRVPKSGGALEIDAEAEEPVRGLAVDGERVYYNDATKLASIRPGEARKLLGRVDAEGRVPIAIDGAAVSWIADGKVWRAQKTGGAPEVVGEAHSEGARLVADELGLAWTEPRDRSVALKRWNGQVARVRWREGAPDDVALDARFAYVADVDTSDGTTRILRLAR